MRGLRRAFGEKFPKTLAFAIARRMNAQVRGLSVAEQDAKDGESVVEIADGAMAEVHDMLQRMNELAVKSANGTMSDDDRKTIQDEIVELQNEITRIGETTEYNSQKLFDGTFDLKGYCLNNNNIKVNYYSDEISTGKYNVSLEGIFFNERGEVDTSQGPIATVVRTDLATPQQIPVSVSGDKDQIILTGENGVEIRLDVSAHVVENNGTYTFADIKDADTLELDMTGIGAMTLQIGANEGQTIDLRIPQLSLQQIGIDKTNVATYDGAIRAIGEVDKAIAAISEMRSRLGAYQNRLQHTQTNLATSQENVTAAYSRIMDTDMAEEMTDYSNLQVVTQAATSILAQANERPSQVLQLLQ